MVAGTGELGRLLAIKLESGFRLGGGVVVEASKFLQGGFAPGSTFGNGLFILQLEADLEKLAGSKDSKISVTGLQFNRSPVNFYGGAIQGFTKLPSTPPFNALISIATGSAKDFRTITDICDLASKLRTLFGRVSSSYNSALGLTAQ